MFRLLLSLTYFLSAHATTSPKCESWFLNSGIKTKGESCIIECASLKVDFATFVCGEECDELCGVKREIPDSINELLGFFGFTTDELKLLLAHPVKAKRAYELTKVVDKSVEKLFRRNLPNDESDAARHFIWAGLLVSEFDEQFAKSVLDAHECDLPTSDPERAMDSHNNKEAIKFSYRLKREKRLSIEILEKEVLKAIKEKRLIVISPKGVPRK